MGYVILVTGGNGQLGSELQDLARKYQKDTFYFTDRDTLDITDHQKVLNFIEQKEIQVIINCAAYTAVDKAESDFIASNQLNHIAVRNFALIAKEKSIKLIHISTDYVFNGENFRPYVEEDTPNPASVYGATKLSGEKTLKEINPYNSIIIRTSWVYSTYGNNFVKTMIRLGSERDELGIISDQVGTPTYAKDLAKAILMILPEIECENVETYHFSNEGVCSWYDFAKAIFEIKDMTLIVNAIQTIEYPTPAKRPSYSVLNKTKVKQKFNITIPYWKDSLKECLNTL